MGQEQEQNQEQAQAESLTLEEAFRRLDAVVERLESKDITLEESFQAYQAGMTLLKECSGKIDRVEKRMLQLDQDGELSEF